jgi:hypothetical protein
MYSNVRAKPVINFTQVADKALSAMSIGICFSKITICAITNPANNGTRNPNIIADQNPGDLIDISISELINARRTAVQNPHRAP